MALSNYIPSSRVMQPGVCTSSTRPASPYEGMVIYETDTNKTYVYNGSAWVMMVAADSPPGLELIKTQTIGSAVTTQNVTSCFSANYENYRVTIEDVAASNGGSVFTFKLLSGTTATTSGFYSNTIYIGNGSAGGLSNANYANTADSEFCSRSSTYKGYGALELQAPYATTGTRFQWSSSDDSYWRWGAGIHRANTSYDGFQLVCTSGTMTGGSISVYGYRKSI